MLPWPHDTPRPRFVQFAASALIVALSVCIGRGCGGGNGCPNGQMSICRTDNDCRCGPPCTMQSDCTGSDACVRFAGEPDQPGVCVDALWAYGTAPPCVPLCRETQLCVQWGDRPNSCADTCTSGQTCGSGCCLTLTDGTQACAPAASYCQNSCNPPCAANEVCLALNQPTCAARCTTDSDCTQGCCLALQGGGGACSPGVYCPTMMQPMQPAPCATLDSCVPVQVTSEVAPNAPCGTYGSYSAIARNGCGQTVACRGCWWSPSTQSYSVCSFLGELPPNAAVPIGAMQCAASMYPDPPVKIRCVDQQTYQSGMQCLGTGSL